MKAFLKFSLILAVVCASVCAGITLAQRPGSNAVSARAASGTYDIAKDVSLQGTVLNFTENSQTAPLGAHVLLQTSAGNVDVHLGDARFLRDRKSTRLNSSHQIISYAVFCLKKKKKQEDIGFTHV